MPINCQIECLSIKSRQQQQRLREGVTTRKQQKLLTISKS